MKYVAKSLLVIAMLCSIVPAMAASSDTVSGKSFFLPAANNGTNFRSLGWNMGMHKFDMMDDYYGCFKIQSEYGENFKRDEIGKYLLMNGTNSAVWGPANLAGNTNTTDVSNINFLLTTSHLSTAVFKPKAQDYVTNFGLFVGLDPLLEGLYFQANVPLQHSRWEVEITETPTSTTGNLFNDGEVEQAIVQQPTSPYDSVTAAFKGDATVGDMTNVWRFGRIDGKVSDTKVADIHLTLGYDFVNKEHMNFGFGVHGIIGAGGKSKAERVFEPVFGHDGRHGIGGELHGSMCLWDKDDSHKLMASFNGSAAHLFANEQVRSYDLNNLSTPAGQNVWSRYLLVKVMNPTTFDYTGELDSMINVGTRTAKIGIDVVYDANLSFCYMMDNWSFDLGYTVNGHSKEKHKEFVTSGDNATDSAIAADTFTLYDITNANVDNANGAATQGINGNNVGNASATLAAGSALFITDADLNTDSVLANSALNHGINAGVNYSWMDSDWMPSVGFFGSVNFSGNDNNSFDRWSVGVQGNVSF